MQSIIKPLRSIGFLTIALTLALAANFAYGQWANPTAAPTGGNVAPPVNTSATTQTKAGNFGAATMLAADHMRSPAYCDENGVGPDNAPFTGDDNCFAAADGGAGGGGSSSIVPGWPDAISCDDGSDTKILYITQLEPTNIVRYGMTGKGDRRQIRFDYATQNYAGNDSVSGGNCARDIREFIADGDAFYLTGGGGGSLPTCGDGEIVVTRSGSWVCEPLPGPTPAPVPVDRRWDTSGGYRDTTHSDDFRTFPMQNFELSDTVNYYRLTASTAIGCEQRGCSRMQNDPRIFCYPQTNQNGTWRTIGPVRNATAAGTGFSVRVAGGTQYFKPAPAGGDWFQRIESATPGAREIGLPIRINEDNFLRIHSGDGDDYNCNYSFEFRVID